MSDIHPVPVAAISRPQASYALEPPFDPPNDVYEMVERSLAELRLDAGRIGTAAWNPLGDLIAPGDRVVIKPNFVTSKNFHEPLAGKMLACSSTHGSVLRPIIDYALRACGPRGRICVVDTPVEGCNVEQVIKALGVSALLEDYSRRGHDIPFYDLRYFRVVPRMLLDDVRHWGRSLNVGLLWKEKLPGDPLGYKVIDLGERSHFAEVARRAPRLCFHRSHLHTPVPHHSGGRHEYSLPRSVLAADVIINVAKMKTHKKSGVTLSLKSAIGLCNEKYWLPHYTKGTPAQDGDEYPFQPPAKVRLYNQLQRLPLPPPLSAHSLILRAPRIGTPQNGLIGGYILEGSWEGNDTIWRTTLDLCHILHHADRQGRLQPSPQRRHLAFVDGIIAGEGEGPLAATPRAAGLLIAGEDPVLVDLVATRYMGFSELHVPTIAQALQRPLLPTSNADRLQLRIDGPEPKGAFVPPSTWPSLLGSR